MNDYIFLLGCILLLIMSFQVTKDIISPEVLFPIPWIIATIILITGDFSYNPQSMAFLFINRSSYI